MSTFYDPLVDLSVSPGGPFAIGSVPVCAVQLSEEGDVYYMLDINSRLVRLPKELYLRELWDLDLTDKTMVGEFLESFGPPTPDVQMVSEVSRMSSQAGLPVRATVTLQSIETGVRRLRNTIRCWDHLTVGLDLYDFESGWEGDEPAPVLEKCIDFICDLQPALACFAPTLLRPGEDWPVVDTHSALAAQIFNRIVTGEGFRHCEECHRPFTRYESRVARSGAKPGKARFCSQRCSDRFFNREFRRREQVQKLREQGLSIPKIAEKMNATAAEVKTWLEGVPKKG